MSHLYSFYSLFIYISIGHFLAISTPSYYYLANFLQVSHIDEWTIIPIWKLDLPLHKDNVFGYVLF